MKTTKSQLHSEDTDTLDDCKIIQKPGGAAALKSTASWEKINFPA